MPPKRRILVAFETDHIDKRRKFIVQIGADASNEDLIQEIASYVNIEDPSNIVLELPGGFELRRQDGVDCIEDGEFVTARYHLQHPAQIDSKPSEALTSSVPEVPAIEPGRFRLRLVTAKSARDYARQTPKDQQENPNGVHCFEGQAISGNTTLSSLRTEACRVLGWGEYEEDNECQHEPESACSCVIASEIEQYGLASTLHCRFTTNGSLCKHEACPYSHVSVSGHLAADEPPHCSICGEFLGFPCPDCMKFAAENNIEPGEAVFCPLVQNVGCEHLHHHHCLRGMSSPGCPSGCSAERYPREPTIFDTSERHIVIAYDGDRIERIPIPLTAGTIDSVIQLPTNDIVALVENFLSQKDYERSGLSIRIHSRNPVTECTPLTRSTLVSVCSSSKHTTQNHRRFDLFCHKTYFNRASESTGHFFIDLHTSQSPILACGCARLSELFPPTNEEISLYAVKRHRQPDNTQNVGNKGVASKQGMYLSDMSYQPCTVQTPRGMSAFLASLYRLCALVADKGSAAERRIISSLYTITRFPPAARALAVLLHNKNPLPEERAALSEAIFHALRDFIPAGIQGPVQISTNPGRFFEAARILLGHILTMGEVTDSNLANPVVEDISLVCSVSQKRLVDPVLLGTEHVNRDIGALRRIGGELHRPSHRTAVPAVMDMDDSTKLVLNQLLSHSKLLESSSKLVFFPNRVDPPSSSSVYSLDSLGRDFHSAIKRVNETDLVTRGPLDLKAANVIPLQIVLDEVGFLAVFTGRGCGTTRDVNFFRPSHGGDTEVDVNDVSHALQKVIAERQAENTWQIDSFDGLSGTNRPPDEAIMLCLDLSNSMNERSGVSRLSKQSEGPSNRLAYDPNVEAQKVIDEIASGVSDNVILENAKQFLNSQGYECRHAWSSYLKKPRNNEVRSFFYSIRWYGSEDRYDLLNNLRLIASREALRYHEILESRPDLRDEMVNLAHFAFACSHHKNQILELLRNPIKVESTGFGPFDVPIRLLDPKTGDLLCNPKNPLNAPNEGILVNSDSCDYFEQCQNWPLGYYEPFESVLGAYTELKTWVSAGDLLSPLNDDDGEFVPITCKHKGKQMTWYLPLTTTIRTLYAICNRFTEAAYCSFAIKRSRFFVKLSDLRISMTTLSRGGIIELVQTVPHNRARITAEVSLQGSHVDLLLPRNASALCVLSYLHQLNELPMSQMRLWDNLTDTGDGMRRGFMFDYLDDCPRRFRQNRTEPHKFEIMTWSWRLTAERRAKEESKHLTRLHVLKELVNHLLNRAGSFDTSVSLVLGLITFSDTVSIKQELTPIFENFRRQLEDVNAKGDTSLYDALNTARSTLVNYRKDLPGLRKRIIVVSDGDDNKSISSARDVAIALQKDQVVVDSVQVGTYSNATLHAISVATNGYRFAPQTSLSDALSIFDLETMLSSIERPPKPAPPQIHGIWEWNILRNTSLYPIDVVTIDRFPKRADHSKLNENVQPASKSVQAGSSQNDRQKRIMRELRDIVRDPHTNIDVYVNESDVSFFKLILEVCFGVVALGLSRIFWIQSTKGYRKLRIRWWNIPFDILPEFYPRDPPNIRFVTFILHPNISKQGKVCIAELGRLWSSDISLKDTLSLVYGLLLTPDLENPVEMQASLTYYEDGGSFALHAANAVRDHASKTRQAWKEELSNEVEDDGGVDDLY
ncbi:uncharacterized protein EV420DRAFT_1548064 [Desarmillaria tabescens]|uniref:UBC core domain-containing protein n=1 Tax=Armillaria tabescens TaxID=1929756 RepID=A0AA39KAC2_ARMTA|nr:uncharacterized protein EV420DRAFT_1548064 [Desarmillaria tabescens]KAK0457420.1 hypothetical protein EV420DRAFT_1548064 [Desarmillaria tabescens]